MKFIASPTKHVTRQTVSTKSDYSLQRVSFFDNDVDGELLSNKISPLTLTVPPKTNVKTFFFVAIKKTCHDTRKISNLGGFFYFPPPFIRHAPTSQSKNGSTQLPDKSSTGAAFRQGEWERGEMLWARLLTVHSSSHLLNCFSGSVAVEQTGMGHFEAGPVWHTILRRCQWWRHCRRYQRWTR